MRTCTCKDWEPGIEKINAYIGLQFARSGGATQYTGKPFEYCPWCGKKLIDDEDTQKVTSQDCDKCGNKRKYCDHCTKAVQPKLKKNLQLPQRPNTKCPLGGRHKWVYHIPATGIRFGHFKCEKCNVKQFDAAKGKQ